MLAQGQINFNLDDQVEAAQNELLKEDVKAGEKAHQKLDSLMEKSGNILLHAKAVFPFDLFPDEIVIDATQVNLISRQFFWSDRRHSISIQNIGDVLIDTIPFFASLKLVDRNYTENIVEIKFLKKNDAIRARRIIQGLMVATRENVDLTLIEDSDLLEKIEELGKIKIED